MLDVKNVTKELSDANTAIENRIQKASEWSQAGDEYDYAKNWQMNILLWQERKILLMPRKTG